MTHRESTPVGPSHWAYSALAWLSLAALSAVLIALAWTITTRTPSRYVPLAAQSRLLPVPYSAPASTTSGTPSAL